MVNTVIYVYYYIEGILMYFVLGCPQYSNENLNNKKNLISNLIKFPFKINIKYCQRLDFEAFPFQI